MTMIKPQKPYLVSRRMDVLNLDRTPSKIMDQICPRTIPPIRLGMKKTVLNRLLPLIPFVRIYAMAKARTLMSITDTIVYRAVYQKAWKKDGS